MKKTFLLILAAHLTACNQADPSSSSTPPPKPNIQSIFTKEEYLFNYMGFSPCTKATRADVLEIFKKNEATNLKTTIDSKFELTSIEGKIGKGAKSIDLRVDLWSDRILSLTISEFYPKYISEMKEAYGLPIDELDHTTAGGDTHNKIIYKNPSQDVSLRLQSLIYRGEKLPPYFIFECTPLETEYKISKSKILGK